MYKNYYNNFVNKILWLFLLIIFYSSYSAGAPPTALRSKIIRSGRALFQGPQVYLTVSPDAGFRDEGRNVVLLDRMLEMHWDNFQYLPNDTIALLSENPMEMNVSLINEFILESHIINSSSGNVKTSIRYERKPLNASMDKCLGFWIAVIRGTEFGKLKVLMAECLRVHPTWMNDIKEEIRKIPLSSLMIPGTHNSGSWIYYAGRPSEGVLIEYTYCQEDSIYEQLINGIRSLDIRVGYYPNTQEKFYINHDAVRIRPLRTLLEDVRKFTLETNEIVFLDFHRFPVGFNSPNIHHSLVSFLQDQLAGLLAPKSLTLRATPEQFWEMNRTILLFYSNSEMVSEYDILWPGIEQAWADTNKLNELESFLESEIESQGCEGTAWSLMAQLTFTIEDILVRPSFGIRGYASMSNNAISKWFQRESWYSRSMIVALDFYRGTNLIETAISVNKNMGNACI